jgi:hypothetical protein
MPALHALEKSRVREEVLRALTRRVQAEYAEMPGLSVTLAQAQRWLATDRQTCAAVFRDLTERGVLRRTVEGRYVRARWSPHVRGEGSWINRLTS